MYWSGVVRPGDQIDTSVNPNLIPPQTSPITPLHPVFNYHSTELLVQGFNVGVDMPVILATTARNKGKMTAMEWTKKNYGQEVLP